MVETPWVDWNSFISLIFSLSIWALFDFTGTDSLEGSGLVSYGKEPKPQGRSAGKGRTSCALAPSFPILLLGLGGRRLTLMLHEMTCLFGRDTQVDATAPSLRRSLRWGDGHVKFCLK